MSAGIASLGGRVQQWFREADLAPVQQQYQKDNTTAAAAPHVPCAVQAAATGADGSQGQQQQDMECIRSAFSPVAVLGIRSLPDALHPGYRLELLQQMLAADKHRQQSSSQACTSGQQCSPDVQRGDNNAQRHKTDTCQAAAVASGRVPQRFGPMQGYFSCFQHLTSEYERRDVVDKFARLNSKLAQVGVDDFVVRGCPPPCQHSTTFTTYQHDLPPYQEVDHLGRPLHSPPRQRVRPFIPAGRSSSAEVMLRGLTADLLMALEAALSKDWPHSFIKAFMDQEGCVVLSFDHAAAAVEGDLTSYLNHQEKHGSIMMEFRLVKDPERWGVLEGDGVSVFYVLTPPWCRSKTAMHLQQQEL